jgi:hypothetical protein
MRIQHVTQTNRSDCWIACVAMITGQDYQQINNEVDSRCASDRAHYQWFEVFARYGFAVQFIYREQQIGWSQQLQEVCDARQRPIWPLSPWAPAHIVQVGDHYIVMDRTGAVFDPALTAEISGTRRLSDYPNVEIHAMAGVIPVGFRPSFDGKIRCPDCIIAMEPPESVGQHYPPGYLWCGKNSRPCWEAGSETAPKWCPGFRLRHESVSDQSGPVPYVISRSNA